MKIAVEVSHSLPKVNLHNLTVTLTDERFGPTGHKDSNWFQLEKAGFKLRGVKMSPVLNGGNILQTARNYAQMLKKSLHHADYSLALAGMGADGHILGIKPNSPAVNSTQLAVGYNWDDFERLTLTETALKLLDEAVIYTVGEEKWPQLDLLKQTVSAEIQPAQILKKLKKVTILNDHLSS